MAIKQSKNKKSSFKMLFYFLITVLFALNCAMYPTQGGNKTDSKNHSNDAKPEMSDDFEKAKSLIIKGYESQNLNCSNIIVKFKKQPNVKSGINDFKPELYATDNLKEYKTGKFKRIVPDESIDMIKKRMIREKGGLSAETERNLDSASGLYTLNVEYLSSPEIKKLLNKLNNDPSVEYAEPDYKIKIKESNYIPQDPLFNECWGLEKIGMKQAWNVTKGSPSVIVAVIDTGINYNHEDLTGQIHDNRNLGWDFYNHHSNPMDDNGHGTNIAGIIAAYGNNNLGVAGIGFNVKILSLKVFGAAQDTNISYSIEAIYRAIEVGAHIINASYGYDISAQYGQDAYVYSEYEAILRARDANILFVAACDNKNVDADFTSVYPASYWLENVISVTASNQNDDICSFAEYGKNSIDIAAPGENILTCGLSNNSYERVAGTSYAAPHVSGVAALLKSINMNLTPKQIKKLILDNADKLPNLYDKVYQGRRLNADKAVRAALNLKNGIYEFKTPGNFTWSISQIKAMYPNITGLKFNLTVIGGGGGGGGSASHKSSSGYGAGGGGGGAGRYLYYDNIILDENAVYSITVGKGGSGGPGGSKARSGGWGASGQSSFFDNITAEPGSGGQGGDNNGGSSGGSAGIGYPNGNDNYGNGYGGAGGDNGECGFGAGASPASSGKPGASAKANSGCGGGGAGGAKTSYSADPGGSGGSGYVRIEWMGYVY